VAFLEKIMTLSEAIEALTRARTVLGGHAPLLMADGLPVVSFAIDHDIVYICDAPEGEGVEG
jgi:hypothetical protein